VSQGTHNIYAFLPVERMRALFEAANGRPVSWPAVVTAVDETNVVPMGKTGGF